MSLRKWLPGLVGVLAVAGVAPAEPPVNPLVEGREPDPVTREFYQSDKPPGGYVSTPSVLEQPNSGAWVVIAAGVWDLLLDRLTFPLGTAEMKNEPTGA